MQRSHIVIISVVAIATVIAIIIVACNIYIIKTTNGSITNSPTLLPTSGTVLVLGTAPLRKNGEPNPYFHHRLEAIWRIWQTHHYNKIILSGYGQETKAMRHLLVDKGIPTEIIREDSMGKRTMASMSRLKEIFQLNECIVVSQRFHCQRAIFLARALGIKAVGFAAQDVHNNKTWLIQLREWLAKVKAYLEVMKLKMEFQQ